MPTPPANGGQAAPTRRNVRLPKQYVEALRVLALLGAGRLKGVGGLGGKGVGQESVESRVKTSVDGEEK